MASKRHLNHTTLFFDGSCKDEQVSFGWVVLDERGKHQASGSGLGSSGKGITNNHAEFEALEAGLLYLESQKVKIQVLICRGDSGLVIEQINGRAKFTRVDYSEICKRIRELLNKVAKTFTVRWIPRELNLHADKLARLAWRKKKTT